MHGACTVRRIRLAVESKTGAGTYPNTPTSTCRFPTRCT